MIDEVEQRVLDFLQRETSSCRITFSRRENEKRNNSYARTFWWKITENELNQGERNVEGSEV